MAGCRATKANGEPCGGTPASGNDYCPAHDPARAEARKRAARKAGKKSGSKSAAEIAEYKQEIRAILSGLLHHRIEKGVASIAFQGWGLLLRACEVEQRMKEVEELEERIEQVEAFMEEDERRKRHGQL